MENNQQYRIMTYVQGLLYFYGVICFADLSAIVQKQFGAEQSGDELRSILAQGIFQGSFKGQGDCYAQLEVDDVDWVLAGQAKRDEIDFRPVFAEEAEYVVEGKIPLLWNKEQLDFFRWLIEHCDNDAEQAALLLLGYEAKIRNNVQPLDLAQDVVEDLALVEATEIRQAAQSVLELYKHVPLWTLKGWTPADVLYGE